MKKKQFFETVIQGNLTYKMVQTYLRWVRHGEKDPVKDSH